MSDLCDLIRSEYGACRGHCCGQEGDAEHDCCSLHCGCYCCSLHCGRYCCSFQSPARCVRTVHGDAMSDGFSSLLLARISHLVGTFAHTYIARQMTPSEKCSVLQEEFVRTSTAIAFHVAPRRATYRITRRTASGTWHLAGSCESLPK